MRPTYFQSLTYLALMYPAAPLGRRIKTAERMAGRAWKALDYAGVTSMTNGIRHKLTDYDKLMGLGLLWEEARLTIGAEVRDIEQRWRHGGLKRWATINNRPLPLALQEEETARNLAEYRGLYALTASIDDADPSLPPIVYLILREAERYLYDTSASAIFRYPDDAEFLHLPVMEMEEG